MPSEYAAAKDGMNDVALQSRLRGKLAAIDVGMRDDPNVIHGLGLVVQREMTVACYRDLSRRLLQERAPRACEAIKARQRDWNSTTA